jgi:nicotinate-nucleotide adenylyltransferase
VGTAGGRKLGLFGGTFDPPHLGHLILARDAREALGLDSVVWIPARRSPLKTGADTSSAPARLSLVEAAVRGAEGFEVWSGELDRPAPSYTVDTVRHFRSTFPEAELYLLLGTDQWSQFTRWHRPDEIAACAHLVVLHRGGAAGAAGGSDAPDGAGPEAGDPFPCTHLAARRIDVSSTEIRDRVRAGRSIRYLVTDEVGAVVDRLQLYRRRGEVPDPGSIPVAPSPSTRPLER